MDFDGTTWTQMTRHNLPLIVIKGRKSEERGAQSDELLFATLPHSTSHADDEVLQGAGKNLPRPRCPRRR